MSVQSQIQQIIDQKTKPLGALGQLEQIAFQLATLADKRGEEFRSLSIRKPQVIVFAGDHGIAAQGVSIAPSAVTQQMVYNFLNGGAAINCFCRSNDIELTVVDCGIEQAIEHENSALVLQRLGSGTSDLSHSAAMSAEQCHQGLELGAQIVKQKVAGGSEVLLFGEMGIGNTSSASAILAALSQEPVGKCVGLGTGITEEQYKRKVDLVAQAVARCHDLPPQEVLEQVGGFEIVQMVGAFLQASKSNTPVIVDGFIVTVAAYVATLIEPDSREVMIFGHQSEESGHQIVLNLLEAKPLLSLGLRLGEGTGAALALPIVKAAVEFYNNMASFESAGVTV
ncbi:nicotinate-nucleotide--dimethylbenzimidazole phosphoribosyltransferase [Vibrio maerlii]|uniref:nicotinate-nucleotide--dimethylbenzimidazole phosphoribosyltransferase n=1 Tax=Vibrio maerlii TaxID=2231648 RepID=UPI000E3E231F|nr:nicotinate-nucleotide--dimethylbenzimidazole phosphoribosyltransferase [Vibrio maerlii]